MITMNLSKREKTLIIICVAAILIAVVYGFIFEPIMNRWGGLDAKIKSKKAVLTKNTKLIRNYKALENEYETYREYIKTGKNEEEELARALAEVDKIAKKSSCDIINVKPRIPKDLGNYKEIFFEVTTAGSVPELAKFLHGVESSTETLRVKHFTISAKSSTPNKLKGVFLISKIVIL